MVLDKRKKDLIDYLVTELFKTIVIINGEIFDVESFQAAYDVLPSHTFIGKNITDLLSENELDFHNNNKVFKDIYLTKISVISKIRYEYNKNEKYKLLARV